MSPFSSNAILPIKPSNVTLLIAAAIFSDSIEVNLSFIRSMIGSVSIIGIYFLVLQIKHYTNLEYDIQWLIIGISIPLTANILKSKQGHEQI